MTGKARDEEEELVVTRLWPETVWSRDEEGRRARSEESDDGRDTWKKEEMETEDKMEGRVQKRRMQTVGPRAGEEGDRAYRRESEDQQPYGDPR